MPETPAPTLRAGSALPPGLASLRLSSAVARALGLPSAVLELEAARPRGEGDLLLQYRAGPELVAGQWIADPDRLSRVAAATRESAPDGAVALLGERGVLLQVRGADRRLVGLADLVAGGRLVAHRPEQRAVVRVGGEVPTWIKVVRPDRTEALVTASRAAATVPGVRTARLLDVDAGAGRTVWSHMAGSTLHELLGTPVAVHGFRRAGAALRALHGAVPAVGLPGHHPEDEAEVVRRWARRRAAYDPARASEATDLATDAVAALAGDAGPAVMVHRDFYDKQVCVADGEVGLLDFDTLALGEAALDLGNALAHCELRAVQGLGDQSAAAAALVERYAPDAMTRARLPGYVRASRFRLWCVYAFRPRWAAAVEDLRQRLNAPPPGIS